MHGSTAEKNFTPIASRHEHNAFSHSEEDLETLLQFCHQNKVAENIFSKVTALSSRNDVINTLNLLRLKRYLPNQLILLQNMVSPNPLDEASYTVIKGSVTKVQLPEVMFAAESVKQIYARVEEGDLQPHVQVGPLNEMLMAGDEEVYGVNTR